MARACERAAEGGREAAPREGRRERSERRGWGGARLCGAVRRDSKGQPGGGRRRRKHWKERTK
ncbi:hypothetical protein DM2_2698 [Halorubrum sp. DM2]|nr:hypothetical protein DM2_2698 [Halorubrum sp. DM2]